MDPTACPLPNLDAVELLGGTRAYARKTVVENLAITHPAGEYPAAGVAPFDAGFTPVPASARIDELAIMYLGLLHSKRAQTTPLCLLDLHMVQMHPHMKPTEDRPMHLWTMQGHV